MTDIAALLEQVIGCAEARGFYPSPRRSSKRAKIRPIDTSSTPARLGSALTAVLLLVVLLVFGFVAGGLVATRVLSTGGMGWDQLADTLGGVAVGTMAGLVVWIAAVRRLSPPARVKWSIAGVVATAAAAAYMNVVPPNVREPRVVAIPPVMPRFQLALSTAEGVEGPTAPERRLPWRLFRTASNLSFDYIPYDDGRQMCMAAGLDSPAAISSLTGVRAALAGLPSVIDCGEPCPSCDEIGLEWYLDDARSTLSLTDQCWTSHAALQPLRVAIDELLTTYRSQVVCESTGR